MKKEKLMLAHEEFLLILKSELDLTDGCTDPVAIALATARAASELKSEIERINVQVSPNIYKNTFAVGVPGANCENNQIIRGGAIAAAIGSQLKDSWKKGLEILNATTELSISKAKQLISEKKVNITFISTPDPLFIMVTVYGNNEIASAVISGNYNNISLVEYNEETIFSNPQPPLKVKENYLTHYRLRDLINLVQEIEAYQYDFLIEALNTNLNAAINGARSNILKIGPNLIQQAVKNKGITEAHALVASATEARMAGLHTPIMAISGSGNHGITLFTGLASLNNQLKPNLDTLAYALAIGATVTTYIKGYIKRMTAFCGCSVAAATGLGAGAVYLMGGNYDDMEHAMQSVIGTFAGMLCDGAKESCAFKVSTVAQSAIQYAELAIKGVFLPAGVGILGKDIEETFSNLGKLNNPAMLKTDEFLLELIKKRNE